MVFHPRKAIFHGTISVSLQTGRPAQHMIHVCPDDPQNLETKMESMNAQTISGDYNGIKKFDQGALKSFLWIAASETLTFSMTVGNL
jgi:hypothetical protein